MKRAAIFLSVIKNEGGRTAALCGAMARQARRLETSAGLLTSCAPAFSLAPRLIANGIELVSWKNRENTEETEINGKDGKGFI